MSKKEIITLALLVALLPPIWAVASPYLGNYMGPVALITAGIYATNGNRKEDAVKISIGYLLGDMWSLIVVKAMSVLPFNADITLFVLLAVLGFLVVIISSRFPKYIFMPAWLTGWAIAMLAMNLDTTTPLYSLTLQIGVAMLVGVFYIGVALDLIHKRINNSDRDNN